MSLVISTFGAMTSYLVIITDMLGPIVGEWMGGTNKDFCSFWASRYCIITFALLVVVPPSLLKVGPYHKYPITVLSH